MDKKARETYFRLVNTRYQRCLEPQEQCNSAPIRAHSIQNSRILDQMSDDGHVMMPRLSHDPNGTPVVEFKTIGRNQATTFTGLCSTHDAEIFRPIDTNRLDVADPEHLFLLAYRAVLKESHACLETACKFQSVYQARVEAGTSPRDRPDAAGLQAVEWLCNAYDMYLYKRKYDDAYLNKNHSRIAHRHIQLDHVPVSIAVSALFSLDDIEWPDDVARVAMNVFPFEGKVHVVFSFLAKEARFAEQYLQKVFSARGHYQRYLISKTVLQHCANFVVAPSYYETMSEEKKRALIDFFRHTLSRNQHDYENENLYLF